MNAGRFSEELGLVAVSRASWVDGPFLHFINSKEGAGGDVSVSNLG